MKHFHPLTLILLWLALMLVLPLISLSQLLACTGLGLFAALLFAREHCWRMLRRMRWLLLTTALLFVWFTPGEYVTRLPGVTYEGLQAGVRQLCTLLLFVSLLAVLLGQLGAPYLIAALHALFAPLACAGFGRDRAATRLLLVLDYLDRPQALPGWRALLNESPRWEHAPLSLPHLRWSWRDGLLLVVVMLVVLAWRWSV